MSALDFRGTHREFFYDHSPAVDLEGALSCGKTTVCLCKEIRQLKAHPGMHALFARWTDDAVSKLLRPAVEQMARIEHFDIAWQGDKLAYYACENAARIYCFGLKTQSQEPEQRYGKIRGLPVSRIYVDQAEQLPGDIASELLLRLRPDLEQRLGGHDFPRQLTFSPNPVNYDHWLAKQFPVDNHIVGRKYYTLSLFDNAHNLPDDMIANALIEYPQDHPKHATVILGQRGPNVIGDAVYDTLFDRALHLKPLTPSDDVPFLEAFEFGKHNPVWILAQRSTHGALNLLGGVLGQGLMLEDFLPRVRRYRDEWTAGTQRKIYTCCSNIGEERVDRARYSLVKLLRDAGYTPVWQDSANAHDVQLAMIETISSALRRRTAAKEEALAITSDPSRWLIAFPDGSELRKPFMSFAFEGGYVWSAHTVSVANKELRQPRADDEYANIMRGVENLMLNFVAGQRTDDDRKQASRVALEAAASAQESGSAHDWMRW